MRRLTQLYEILNSYQKKQFLILFFLMLISMFLEIAVLKFTLILLNYFSASQDNVNSSIFIYLKNLNINLEFSLLLIIIYFTIFLLKTFINIFILGKKGKFIFSTKEKISLKFMKGYLYMPRIFHMRTNTSELIKNITVEMDNLLATLLSLSSLMLESLVLIGIITFLFFVNFKITFITLIFLSIFAFFISGMNTKQMTLMGRERIKLVQLRLKNVIEGLSGSKTYEMTGSRDKAIEDFDINNKKISKISYRFFIRTGLPKPLFELIVVLFLAAFFVFIYFQNIKISLIIPTLGVFLAAVYRLIPSFANIMSSLANFQFNSQCLTILLRDLDKFKKIKNINQNKIDFSKELVLEKISFSYEKNINLEKQFIIKNLNFTLKKGSKIGIIGSSGSGKSTFLDILMGLLPPQNGNILVDGKSIKDSMSGWQKNIGCVPQEVFIIEDTLRKNIAFGLSEEIIDEEKLDKAIETAGLKEFTKNLNLKVNTIIGEGGSRISGGQRQRIGIARALYNEPEILIFDEGTNALDKETEEKIINEIFSKNKNRTIIFVSHNEKILKDCDNIYKINQKTLSKIK